MNIQQAALAIKAGSVIAYPTESVWGLGCDPWNQQAVTKLLSIKQRPQAKGLIIVASSFKQIKPICNNLTDSQLKQLQATWPGPCNWIIPDTKSWLPDIVKGNHQSIAVRISSHPIIVNLCEAIGFPIISTSANISKHKPYTTANDILKNFGTQIAGVVQGELGGKQNPCIIRDLLTDKIIRED